MEPSINQIKLCMLCTRQGTGACAFGGRLGPCRGAKGRIAQQCIGVYKTRSFLSCLPFTLGNSDHNTQLCYLSVMLQRIGPEPGWGEQCPTERSGDLRMESWDSAGTPAGLGAPGWLPPALPNSD